MNNCSFIGRLTAAPDTRYTNNDKVVTRFSIAVDRRFKRDGGPTADFIPVVAWEKTADFAIKYFRKGLRIGVTGELQTRTYKTETGETRHAWEIIAQSLDFADGKNDGAGQAPAGTGATGTGATGTGAQTGYYTVAPDEDDEDLPF